VRAVRASRLALVALVAAALGAGAALGISRGAGWIGPRSTKTVVLREGEGSAPAAVRTVVAALPAGRFDPARLYRNRSAGVVTIFSYFGASSDPAATVAQGSGFVVSPRGYVLTNSHVITTAGEGGPVGPAREIYVEFSDHDRVRARIVGWDVFDDVGLIKVAPHVHALAPVPLGDSAAVVVGEPVAAIGSPLGNENSLTVGVVSGVRRAIEALTAPAQYRLIDAIQTDAPITHGNSGGPLFDARGRVIGINAQIRSERSGGNDTGVGFAVPINSAKRSMAQLIKTGKVEYAFVGITTADLTPSLARHFGYPVDHGAIVDEVAPGSAGARAGLRGGTRTVRFAGIEFRRGGDVIVAIDRTPIRSADDVVRIVSEQLLPGETATFTVIRGHVRRIIQVHLAARPAD
jgi:S1-C subfamily serine protease